jgi:hypothetical protein
MNKRCITVGLLGFCSLLSYPFISFAKSENDVPFLVPGKSFSSVSCNVTNGEITPPDTVYVDSKGVAWGYDKYSFAPQLGKIIFIEIITQDMQSIGLTYHWADMQNSSYGVNSPQQITTKKNRFASYIDTSNKSLLNLYISRNTYGKYTLRVAMVNPTNNISQSEIDKVVDDFNPTSSIMDTRKLGYLIRGEDDPKDLVSMKALCQKGRNY